MAEKKKNEVAVKKPSIIEVTEKRIQALMETNEINFPANYSVQNALKSAWLVLQDVEVRGGGLALEKCTQKSISESLFDMAIQGLSPAKKQCYFIPYGNKLTLVRSYHGTKAVVKRLTNVIDAVPCVIYEGDEFSYEIKDARIINVKHSQDFMNIDMDKIKGAYCTIRYYNPKIDDEESYTEVMNINQIKTSWNKTKMKVNSVTKEFPEEMAKRTVVNRAAKHFFNTSDDSDLIIDAVNRTTENEYANKNDDYEVIEDKNENANTKQLDFEEPVDTPFAEEPSPLDIENDDDVPDWVKD